MKFIKDLLKTIKLNEGTISMMLGAVVVVVVGILVVNYFRDLRGSTQQITPTGGSTVSQTLPKSHTIESGENLWGIAEKYYGSGYNWVDIASANSLVNADRILVGQILSIPDVEPKVATLPETGLSAEVANPIIGNSYTVVKGDHLWGIAVRAYGDGYQWVKIASENQISNPDIINPDQVLRLPR